MREIVCIVCPNGCRLTVTEKDGKIDVAGNKCPKGKDFATEEMTRPMRSLTSTVRTAFPSCPVAAVKTDGVIDKKLLFKVMDALAKVKVDKKLKRGDMVIKNVLDTGVNVVLTQDIY